MKKPPYEHKALKKAIKQCGENIKRFREAIENEERYKVELMFYVTQHEEYEKEKKEKEGK